MVKLAGSFDIAETARDARGSANELIELDRFRSCTATVRTIRRLLTGAQIAGIPAPSLALIGADDLARPGVEALQKLRPETPVVVIAPQCGRTHPPSQSG